MRDQPVLPPPAGRLLIEFHLKFMPQTASAIAMEESSRSDTAAVVRQIAHELRQPLSTIESIAYYLEIILPRGEDKPREQLARLQQLVHQANWIINDAVHYCQASPPHPELLDLAEVISNCAADMSLSERLQLNLSLPRKSPLVRLDPGQARHLLRNLCTFFHRICSPGSRVVVRLARQGDEVALCVSTLAARCSAEDLQSLLDFRDLSLDSSAGLAMASVRQIVRAHEGRLEAQTDSEYGLMLTALFPAAG